MPDKHYIVVDKNNHYYDLYGHGGMIFWLISSTVFAFIYTLIFILPYTRFKRTFPLPTKKSFYAYCFILAVICLIQSLGSLLTYFNVGNYVLGLCILDVTTFIYFTFFGPLVYIVFLRKFFQKEAMIPSSYFKENETSYISNSVSINDNGSYLNNPINSGPLLTAYKPDRNDNGATSSYSGLLPSSIYSQHKSQLLDCFDETVGDASENIIDNQSCSYNDKHTTSNLIEVRNSLNHLQKDSRFINSYDKGQSNILSYDENQIEDHFYCDDDDTKVILVESLD
jgi:hypothetical protein